MDIKAPKEKYSKIIGFGNSSQYYLLDNVEKSINILKKGKVDYEFRTTVVPGFLEKNDILEIVNWLKPAKKYVLQNFRPGKTLDKKLLNIQPYADDFFFSVKEIITPFFETVEIRC